MTQTPFQLALGANFSDLPDALQRFHSCEGQLRFVGRVCVEHGGGVFPALAAKLAGFPKASPDISMAVTVTSHNGSERWVRMFGTHETASELAFDTATSTIIERFGPITCALVLALENSVLTVAIARASVMGVRLPKYFAPRSESREWQDDQGRFCFDISAFYGRDKLLIRYSGWLEPDA